MESKEIERAMRDLEYFHSLHCLSGAWIILRLDGRNFSKLTATHFEKPFDLRFQEIMRKTSQALLEAFQGIYCCTHSDEISLLLPRDANLFERKVEKLISLSASLAGATFTLAFQQVVQFDSRIWLGVENSQVIDYFRWRQADAARCALNDWCHWTLINEGKTPMEAMEQIQKKSTSWKHELLFQRGINFAGLPLWQRRGTGFYWETYEKEGFDPVRQLDVTATRRRLKLDEALPLKEAYDLFLQEILNANSRR